MKIKEFKPLRKGALLGFAKVETPSGMILNDVTILTGERGAWASPPSKPQINREGAVIKDDAGKMKYTPIIEFSSKEVRGKFSDAVIAAMQAAHPEAFQ